MCTVTFIRVKDSVFLTSNRDEKLMRSQALPPAACQLKDARLLFPKDADKGGTWIALKDNSTAGVLLNGAFINHQSVAPFKRSRGLILIDVLSAPVPITCFSQMELDGIEPFTLILFGDFKLYECRWDGAKKYVKRCSVEENHIWSSATLYDETVQRKREGWFIKWQLSNAWPSQRDIFHFHQFAGDGDEQNSVRMNRAGQLFTVSITGIQIKGETGIMKYLDLIDGKAYSAKLDHAGPYAVNEKS